MKHVFLAVLVVAAPLAVAAQSSEVDSSTTRTREIGLYYQSSISKGEDGTGAISHRVFVQGYSYLSEKAGVWGFTYGEKAYVSGTIGLYYDLFTIGDAVFEIGVAGGAERLGEIYGSGTYGRIAGMVFFGTDDLYLGAYYENGASKEPWTRIDVVWSPSDIVSVGGIYQTGDGIGPRLILSPPDLPIRLWGSRTFSKSGDSNFLLGAEIVFGN